MYLKLPSFFSVAALIGIAACSAERPQVTACGHDYAARRVSQSEFDPLLEAARNASMAVSIEDAQESMADSIRQVTREVEGPVIIEILALSAGGQFGAFGAGFMRGWAENSSSPRPDFQIVTGVSAGAMLSPIVFAGNGFDEALDGYRGLSESEVFRSRPAITLLGSPSVASVAPLERFLEARLSEPLIEEVARRHAAGQGLFVLATDLDTTEATVFDLGALAASDQSFKAKQTCMREALLASSAIPGLFPPRNIDGSLYADGGLRDQIFLQSVADVQDQVQRETGRSIRVSATIVINGALKPPPEPTKDSILSYAKRGAVVLADEVLRDSVAEVVNFAQSQRDWQVRGIIANTSLKGCKLDNLSGTFDPCITARLFDDGREKGRSPVIPWLDSDELLALSREF